MAPHQSTFGCDHPQSMQNASDFDMSYSEAAIFWQNDRLLSLPAGALPPVAKSFRFLDLPTELRLMVYKLAVPSASTKCMCADLSPVSAEETSCSCSCLLISGPSDEDKEWQITPIPAICQTNRQVRNESLPFYYDNYIRLSCWSMDSLDSLLVWIESGLDDKKGAIIRRLDLSVGDVLVVDFGLDGGQKDIHFHHGNGLDVGHLLPRSEQLADDLEAVLWEMDTPTRTDSGFRGYHVARILDVLFDKNKLIPKCLRMRIKYLCVEPARRDITRRPKVPRWRWRG